MDETIMIPSLLRDVPLDEQENQSSCDMQSCLPSQQRDMYEHYLLLKSIRNDMQWGLSRQEVCGTYADRVLKQDVQQDLDLQGLFHYHLQGLFVVLSKLTAQANRLTNRYKREISGGSLIRSCSTG